MLALDYVQLVWNRRRVEQRTDPFARRGVGVAVAEDEGMSSERLDDSGEGIERVFANDAFFELAEMLSAAGRADKAVIFDEIFERRIHDTLLRIYFTI